MTSLRKSQLCYHLLKSIHEQCEMMLAPIHSIMFCNSSFSDKCVRISLAIARASSWAQHFTDCQAQHSQQIGSSSQQIGSSSQQIASSSQQIGSSSQQIGSSSQQIGSSSQQIGSSSQQIASSSQQIGSSSQQDRK